MRTLNKESLSLYLFHQLSSRLGAMESDENAGEMDSTTTMRLLLGILNEIPGMEAREAPGMNIEVNFSGSEERRTIPVQNVVDSLQVVWKEFQESAGDR